MLGISQCVTHLSTKIMVPYKNIILSYKYSIY